MSDPTMTMVASINATLAAEMERDERVVVFGEDVALSGGVFRATDGLLDRFGEDRVVDMPLAEAAILGAAVGLAAGGMVPVPEIQFLGFSYQAMHQLAGQIARFRYRTQGRFAMPITIRAPYGGGVRTPELHSDSLEGQLTNIAGLKVVTPSTAADAKGLLTEAIRDPDPVVFLEPLRGYRGVKGPVPEGEYRVPFGKARWATPGDDVTIITWSYQVEVALRAARNLAQQGLSVGVLDLRTLVPLDVEEIMAAVERTGRVVVVEEAVPTGGFAAEVIATINEHAFWSLEAPPVRVSGFDAPYPVGQLEDTYVPDARRIEAAVLRLLEVRP
jgi:pyruvate dehydrogenase E1 component beta subunit